VFADVLRNGSASGFDNAAIVMMSLLIISKNKLSSGFLDYLSVVESLHRLK
jgi:hypothetical protein